MSVSKQPATSREGDPSGGLGRLYGRRHGKKLRPHQKALFETLLPNIELNLPAGELDPRAAFAGEPAQKLWLEIGYGGGEHMVAQAKAHPTVGVIGCEFFINGIAKALAQIEVHSLTNIRLYTEDARDLLLKLTPQSIDRIFVLFPDPWPKSRHAKRRIISDWSLDQFARILKPGGELRVATDIPAYCRWTLEHIRRHPDFKWTAQGPQDWRERPSDAVATRYENKAMTAGRTPVYLTFVRA
jgi:tRNA (guanine-N7-)-methyltransferase